MLIECSRYAPRSRLTLGFKPVFVRKNRKMVQNQAGIGALHSGILYRSMRMPTWREGCFKWREVDQIRSRRGGANEQLSWNKNYFP